MLLRRKVAMLCVSREKLQRKTRTAPEQVLHCFYGSRCWFVLRDDFVSNVLVLKCAKTMIVSLQLQIVIPPQVEWKLPGLIKSCRIHDMNAACPLDVEKNSSVAALVVIWKEMLPQATSCWFSQYFSLISILPCFTFFFFLTPSTSLHDQFHKNSFMWQPTHCPNTMGTRRRPPHLTLTGLVTAELIALISWQLRPPSDLFILCFTQPSVCVCVF